MATVATEPVDPTRSLQKQKKDKTHYLYVFVIVAGAVLGLVAPEFAQTLKPVGTAFVALIKMMIAPIIFCTIVLGVGSIAKAATVGKVGGLALAYFMAMSTMALAIGLVVGNLIHPGEGLNIQGSEYEVTDSGHGDGEGGTIGFLLGIIPTTLLSSLTAGNILQTLFVALVVGFALQQMGPAGKPVLKAVGHVQALVFRIPIMVMWVAPIGAFGAIAGVVGETGVQAIVSTATLMIAFHLTCVVFIVVILGGLLKIVTGVNIFRLMKYLGREYLLIFSTSSSEAALPRLIASKGVAGVTGAGLATLAGGLQSHRPDLVDGVGIIAGIDRFMSGARALTNFTGNAVATLLIGKWIREIDPVQVERVLSGQDKFDESTMAAHSHGAPEEEPEGAPGAGADGALVEQSVAGKVEAAVGAGAR